MTQEEHDRDEQEIRGRLQEIGRIIRKELPTGWGFSLLVAASGDIKGVTLYISTINRADALQVMREFIANQKEERNWMRDVPRNDLEIVEEFEQWWTQQQKRSIEAWPIKQACREAFDGGRASA